MTFVLVSSEHELTPEIAFVSLTLFNMIRMPMTSIINTSFVIFFLLCFLLYFKTFIFLIFFDFQCYLCWLFKLFRLEELIYICLQLPSSLLRWFIMMCSSICVFMLVCCSNPVPLVRSGAGFNVVKCLFLVRFYFRWRWLRLPFMLRQIRIMS